MSGNLFNSKGIHVGVVNGPAIFDLSGKKLYDLKGTSTAYPASWSII